MAYDDWLEDRDPLLRQTILNRLGGLPMQSDRNRPSVKQKPRISPYAQAEISMLGEKVRQQEEAEEYERAMDEQRIATQNAAREAQIKNYEANQRRYQEEAEAKKVSADKREEKKKRETFDKQLESNAYLKATKKVMEENPKLVPEQQKSLISIQLPIFKMKAYEDVFGLTGLSDIKDKIIPIKGGRLLSGDEFLMEIINIKNDPDISDEEFESILPNLRAKAAGAVQRLRKR